MMEILELFLRRISCSMLLMNWETADVRLDHLLEPFESCDDIEPLLSNIRT